MATATRKAATRKKTSKATPSTVIIKVAGIGKTFKKDSCHGSKAAATKQAENIRRQGNNARVLPGESGKVCVFKGGKTSAKAPRAKSAKRAKA